MDGRLPQYLVQGMYNPSVLAERLYLGKAPRVHVQFFIVVVRCSSERFSVSAV